MAFQLEQDERIRRELNGPVIQGLCSLLNVSNQGVKNADFDENQANITIKSKGGLRVSFPTQEPEDPIQLKAHEHSEKGLHRFSFQFNPGYKLKFTISGGFHSITKEMLGRGKKELEKVLGFYPETVKASFRYDSIPFGLWHAIPRNVLAHISSFRFVSGKLDTINEISLKWPCETGPSYTEKQDESRIYISHGIEKNTYQQLMQKLIDDGLIRREIVEDRTRGGTSEQERLLLTGPGMDYKKMRDFEDHVADLNNGYGTAYLSFSGNIPTTDIVNIPKLFNETIYKAQLAIDLFALFQQSHSNQNIYINGNLETAARVAEILPKHCKEIRYTAVQKSGVRKSVVLFDQK